MINHLRIIAVYVIQIDNNHAFRLRKDLQKLFRLLHISKITIGNVCLQTKSESHLDSRNLAMTSLNNSNIIGQTTWKEVVRICKEIEWTTTKK